MATAKKLPSGNYRVRVYDKETNKYKSFTAPTKREAERMAAQYLDTHETIAVTELTVKQAVEEYIKSKEGVLSPATVRGYYIVYNNALNEISNVKIKNINVKIIQTWISNNAKHYSAKSIKNQFGLVCAALKQNNIRIDLSNIKFPPASKKEPVIPTEEQISQILHLIEGTNVEIPVTMAITLGLRQSEIAGIKWQDYDGQFIYVHCAKVPNKDNKYQFKETTKSEASTRRIEVDDLLKQRLDRAPHKSEFISTMLPSSVLRKFQNICEKNGLPKFTMHAQRHGNASMMLAQNIPDKYAMQRLGQSSPHMIKQVYQHLYDDKMKDVSQTVSRTFSKLYDTKYDTDKKEH